MVRNDGNPNRVRIKASNNYFLQATSAESVLTADYEGPLGWDDSNPSVFDMTKVKSLDGEYQITNGYGPAKAPQVMQNHWDTYITEEDFRFMSSSGLNAVRIPVGWWIAYGQNPPKPFVGGSLQALDKAFTWAQNTGMKVIIDLHAAEGGQNYDAHSGTRDGTPDWGDKYIDKTVQVIDFLAKWYGTHPALAAIELMNEPRAPHVKLETLKTYYKAGYDAVRRHTKTAYVILSNRLGSPVDPKELLLFAPGLGDSKVVIDVHYYNLYLEMFNSFSVEKNIEFIKNNRRSDLAAVTTANGPLTFVGEWTAEWAVNGASMQDFKRFAQAQLEVYGRATFGWAYWSYKHQTDRPKNPWSLKG